MLPEIKQTAPMTVAFVKMRGPYSQIPDGYAKLYGWLEQHWLAPMGMPHAVYLTDPKLDETEAEWELWSPIAGEHPDEGPDADGLGIKKVEPRQVVSALHKGTYESVSETYDALMAWIAEKGMRINGPTEEIHYSKADVEPENCLTEVLVPVVQA